MPKHRGTVAEPALRKSVRGSLVLSGVAVVATGIAVSSGLLLSGGGSGESASASLVSAQVSRGGQSAAPAAAPTAGRPAVELGDRARVALRSDRRTAVDPVKERALNQDS